MVGEKIDFLNGTGLTLTLVVFEWQNLPAIVPRLISLTLTLVVFEFLQKFHSAAQDNV